MSSTEIGKLKKTIAELENRIASLEGEVQELKKSFNDTSTSLEGKYSTFIESMKSLSGVQTRAILDQIRSEIRMDFHKMQRDLQQRGLQI